MIAMTLCALKFLAVSTAFAGLYALFARLKVGAGDRFLLAKIFVFTSPALAFLTLPRADVVSAGFVPGDAVARVVDIGTIAASAPEHSWGQLLLVLYGAVAACLLARFLWSLFRMVRLFRDGSVAGSWQGIPVVEHDFDVPPATFGFFQSRIYVPRALALSLPSSDLELVYAHEAVHVSRADFRWKLAARLLACFTFFSPAWVYLLRRLEEDMELSCDELVRSHAPASTKSYAGLLVRLAETGADARQVPVCSMSSTYQPSILRRISAMKLAVAPSKKRLVFGLLLAALAASLPMLLIGNPPTLADTAPDVKVMDPSAGFVLSVKANIRDEQGHTFKTEISRVVQPGKRIVLAGNDDISLEFQYKAVEGGLETQWFIMNKDHKQVGGGKATIEKDQGATIEANEEKTKAKYSIAFWDVTKKRAMKEGK